MTTTSSEDTTTTAAPTTTTSSEDTTTTAAPTTTTSSEDTTTTAAPTTTTSSEDTTTTAAPTTTTSSEDTTTTAAPTTTTSSEDTTTTAAPTTTTSSEDTTTTAAPTTTTSSEDTTTTAAPTTTTSSEDTTTTAAPTTTTSSEDTTTTAAPTTTTSSEDTTTTAAPTTTTSSEDTTTTAAPTTTTTSTEGPTTTPSPTTTSEPVVGDYREAACINRLPDLISDIPSNCPEKDDGYYFSVFGLAFGPLASSHIGVLRFQYPVDCNSDIATVGRLVGKPHVPYPKYGGSYADRIQSADDARLAFVANHQIPVNTWNDLFELTDQTWVPKTGFAVCAREYGISFVTASEGNFDQSVPTGETPQTYIGHPLFLPVLDIPLIGAKKLAFTQDYQTLLAVVENEGIYQIDASAVDYAPDPEEPDQPAPIGYAQLKLSGSNFKDVVSWGNLTYVCTDSNIVQYRLLNPDDPVLAHEYEETLIFEVPVSDGTHPQAKIEAIESFLPFNALAVCFSGESEQSAGTTLLKVGLVMIETGDLLKSSETASDNFDPLEVYWGMEFAPLLTLSSPAFVDFFTGPVVYSDVYEPTGGGTLTGEKIATPIILNGAIVVIQFTRAIEGNPCDIIIGQIYLQWTAFGGAERFNQFCPGTPVTGSTGSPLTFELSVSSSNILASVAGVPGEPVYNIAEHGSTYDKRTGHRVFVTRKTAPAYGGNLPGIVEFAPFEQITREDKILWNFERVLITNPQGFPNVNDSIVPIDIAFNRSGTIVVLGYEPGTVQYVGVSDTNQLLERSVDIANADYAFSPIESGDDVIRSIAAMPGAEFFSGEVVTDSNNQVAVTQQPPAVNCDLSSPFNVQGSSYTPIGDENFFAIRRPLEELTVDPWFLSDRYFADNPSGGHAKYVLVADCEVKYDLDSGVTSGVSPKITVEVRTQDSVNGELVADSEPFHTIYDNPDVGVGLTNPNVLKNGHVSQQFISELDLLPDATVSVDLIAYGGDPGRQDLMQEGAELLFFRVDNLVEGDDYYLTDLNSYSTTNFDAQVHQIIPNLSDSDEWVHFVNIRVNLPQFTGTEAPGGAENHNHDILIEVQLYDVVGDEVVVIHPIKIQGLHLRNPSYSFVVALSTNDWPGNGNDGHYSQYEIRIRSVRAATLSTPDIQTRIFGIRADAIGADVYRDEVAPETPTHVDHELTKPVEDVCPFIWAVGTRAFESQKIFRSNTPLAGESDPVTEPVVPNPFFNFTGSSVTTYVPHLGVYAVNYTNISVPDYAYLFSEYRGPNIGGNFGLRYAPAANITTEATTTTEAVPDPDDSFLCNQEEPFGLNGKYTGSHMLFGDMQNPILGTSLTTPIVIDEQAFSPEATSTYVLIGVQQINYSLSESATDGSTPTISLGIKKTSGETETWVEDVFRNIYEEPGDETDKLKNQLRTGKVFQHYMYQADLVEGDYISFVTEVGPEDHPRLPYISSNIDFVAIQLDGLTDGVDYYLASEQSFNLDGPETETHQVVGGLTNSQDWLHFVQLRVELGTSTPIYAAVTEPGYTQGAYTHDFEVEVQLWDTDTSEVKVSHPLKIHGYSKRDPIYSFICVLSTNDWVDNVNDGHSDNYEIRIVTHRNTNLGTPKLHTQLFGVRPDSLYADLHRDDFEPDVARTYDYEPVQLDSSNCPLIALLGTRAADLQRLAYSDVPGADDNSVSATPYEQHPYFAYDETYDATDLRSYAPMLSLFVHDYHTLQSSSNPPYLQFHSKYQGPDIGGNFGLIYEPVRKSIPEPTTTAEPAYTDAWVFVACKDGVRGFKDTQVAKLATDSPVLGVCCAKGPSVYFTTEDGKVWRAPTDLSEATLVHVDENLTMTDIAYEYTEQELIIQAKDGDSHLIFAISLAGEFLRVIADESSGLLENLGRMECHPAYPLVYAAGNWSRPVEYLDWPYGPMADGARNSLRFPMILDTQSIAGESESYWLYKAPQFVGYEHGCQALPRSFGFALQPDLTEAQPLPDPTTTTTTTTGDGTTTTGDGTTTTGDGTTTTGDGTTTTGDGTTTTGDGTTTTGDGTTTTGDGTTTTGDGTTTTGSGTTTEDTTSTEGFPDPDTTEEQTTTLGPPADDLVCWETTSGVEAYPANGVVRIEQSLSLVRQMSQTVKNLTPGLRLILTVNLNHLVEVTKIAIARQSGSFLVESLALTTGQHKLEATVPDNGIVTVIIRVLSGNGGFTEIDSVSLRACEEGEFEAQELPSGWQGYLTTGVMDKAKLETGLATCFEAENLPDMRVEPGRLFYAGGLSKKTIEVWNENRTQWSGDPNCNGSAPQSRPAYRKVYEGQPDHFRFSGGYQSTVRQKGTAEVIFGAFAGGGDLGVPPGPIPMPGEPEVDDDFDFIDRGMDCNSVLRTINGVAGPHIILKSDQGVLIEPHTDISRVVIDVNGEGIRACPEVPPPQQVVCLDPRTESCGNIQGNPCPGPPDSRGGYLIDPFIIFGTYSTSEQANTNPYLDSSYGWCSYVRQSHGWQLKESNPAFNCRCVAPKYFGSLDHVTITEAVPIIAHSEFIVKNSHFLFGFDFWQFESATAESGIPELEDLTHAKVSGSLQQPMIPVEQGRYRIQAKYLLEGSAVYYLKEQTTDELLLSGYMDSEQTELLTDFSSEATKEVKLQFFVTGTLRITEVRLVKWL